MTVVISARKVTKRYVLPDGPLALRGIDLDINQGEVFSLLGPNGAGKSTLIALLTGLFPPTQGEIQVAGCDVVRHQVAVKHLIGVVPEEIALYPAMSGVQNLRFFGELQNLDKKRLNSRIGEVLEWIGLAERGNDRVGTYSNGMKRRLNIGIAMLHDPQIYFMDEPTLGLDPENRRRIIELVQGLRRDHNRTFLYTTHNMNEAAEISDRVGIIHNGLIIASGAPAELVRALDAEETIELHILPNTAALPELRQAFESLPHVLRVMFSGDRLVLSVKDATHLLPQVIELLGQARVQVLSMAVKQPDLETVFLHLTGQDLHEVRAQSALRGAKEDLR